MGYKGYIRGDVVVLEEPLPVPDGTEVEIFIPKVKDGRGESRQKSSVVAETFGIIPSDPVVVRAILDEDLYET